MGHSVLVDQNKPNTVTHVAPTAMPVGVIIRLRRSKDLLNSDQRNSRLQQKAKDKDNASQEASEQPRSKDRSVTDILFGTDPEDDKDSSSLQKTDGQAAVPKQISPAMMFSHSVAVRTST